MNNESVNYSNESAIFVEWCSIDMEHPFNEEESKVICASFNCAPHFNGPQFHYHGATEDEKKKNQNIASERIKLKLILSTV